ncbi:hypothetical protein P3T73_14300 [Kiritimatiellota bacterium B12222]|nr:hypothetical protein P3T73_14300 [Kiritimatiellota bacterium B12222]
MRAYFLIPLLLLSACGRQQDLDFPTPESLPSVQVMVSNETPKVGEPVTVDIRVSAEERLVLPPPADWIDTAIEILDSSSTETEDTQPWSKTYQVDLTLFQVTNLSLFAETTVSTLSTPPQELTLPFKTLDVQSVLNTEEEQVPMFGSDELPDFRGSEALKRKRRNIIIGSAVATSILLLIAALIWHFIRKPSKRPPPIRPEVVALRKMDELTQSEIWTNSNADACAVALSSILRIYIESKFHIQAPEQTTEEFLESIEAHAPWPQSEQAGLKRFFEVTDQIKYAAARPGHQVFEDLYQASRNFVTTTSKNEREVQA